MVVTVNQVSGAAGGGERPSIMLLITCSVAAGYCDVAEGAFSCHDGTCSCKLTMHFSVVGLSRAVKPCSSIAVRWQQRRCGSAWQQQRQWQHQQYL
jgi:hypothetical protein